MANLESPVKVTCICRGLVGITQAQWEHANSTQERPHRPGGPHQEPFAVVKITNNPELQPSDKFNYYIWDNQIPLVMIESFDDNCIKITDKIKQNKKGDQ